MWLVGGEMTKEEHAVWTEFLRVYAKFLVSIIVVAFSDPVVHCSCF
jgi:hypothetical protein